MKKLTDCEWRVRLDGEEAESQYWWYAYTDNNSDVEFLMMESWTKTKSGAKRNWQRFAKLNGIKHWKWA